MEQFSLAEYLKNPTRPIVTREGDSVRIICTDRDDQHFSLVGGVIHPTREQALTEHPDYVVDTIQIRWEEKQ